EGDRSRRPRRRLHGEGRRCRLDHPDSESRRRNAAFGGLSSGDLAPARHPSAPQDSADEVGRNAVMTRPAKPAVFLDRDGVLNEAIIRDGKPYPPRDISEFAITAGAKAALDALKREGFLLVVVTNQPDVARGRATRAEVDAINAILAANLPLD